MKPEARTPIIDAGVMYGPDDVQDILSKSVPRNVEMYFSVQSGNLGPESRLKLQQFDRLMALQHLGGQTTYFAQRDIYESDPEKHARLVYAIDTAASGSQIGHGEFMYLPHNNLDYYREKPYVVYTHTQPELEKRGLGRRRLLAMNAASLAVHNLVLHSDTFRLHPGATVIWKKLVSEGLAEAYYEPDCLPDILGNTRFNIKPSAIS